MKPNFLFHVPGASSIFDNEKHRFIYENNWLNLEQLRSMEHKPREVEVVQKTGDRTSRTLGRMATATALLKFSD